MNVHLIDASIYLVRTLFGLYSLAVLCRFLFITFRVGFYSPLGQGILKVTDPCVAPLSKILPFARSLDLASLLLLVLLKGAELFLIFLISRVGMPPFLGLSVWGAGELLKAAAHLLTLAILLTTLQSWFPSLRLPEALDSLLFRLTDPLLSHIRRWIPPLAGMDFSPLAVILVIEFINIWLLTALTQWGKEISLISPLVKGLASFASNIS